MLIAILIVSWLSVGLFVLGMYISYIKETDVEAIGLLALSCIIWPLYLGMLTYIYFSKSRKE